MIGIFYCCNASGCLSSATGAGAGTLPGSSPTPLNSTPSTKALLGPRTERLLKSSSAWATLVGSEEHFRDKASSLKIGGRLVSLETPSSSLVVWGRGDIKERGRLSPDYFVPPSRQVRGQEVAGREHYLSQGATSTGTPETLSSLPCSLQRRQISKDKNKLKPKGATLLVRDLNIITSSSHHISHVCTYSKCNACGLM